MTAYRVIRAAEGDRGPIHRVEDLNGKILSMVELQLLSQLPARWDQGRRHLDFVLTDESQPRHGKPHLRPRALTFDYKPVLTFLESGYAIGEVDDIVICPPGIIPETEGAVALATVTLFRTQLAELAWQSAQEGILNGVCLHGKGRPDPDGELRAYEGRYVVLGSLEGSCVRNARVLRLRETEAVGVEWVAEGIM